MDRNEYNSRRKIPNLTTIVYEKWPEGEFSIIGATNAPLGSFESLNMVVYRDGYFGMRHGVKNLDVQDVRTDAGPVLGLGWRGTPGFDLWWIQDTIVSSIDSRTIGDTPVEWAPGLDMAPTLSPQWVEFSDDLSYVTNAGDKTYRFDHGSQTVNPLGSSPGGLGIAFYGNRMCVGGTPADPQRVFISAVNDPDDWTGGDFFDVPNQSGAVVALWVQRNHLTIWVANGEWWVVTGAAGTTAAFLRRVSAGGAHPWTASANRGAALASDDILHVPISVDIPGRFDGATPNLIPYMAINEQDSPDNEDQVKVLRGMRPDEGVIVFPVTGRFGVYYNDMWTFHKFDPESVSGLTQYWVTDEQGQYLFADDGPGDPAPQFYTWTMNAVEHPGFSTSPLSMPGDDTISRWPEAYIYLPEYWVPDGYNVRVRRVIVDLKEWDSGAEVENSYTITPRTLSRYEDPGFEDGTSQGYSSFPTGGWDTGVGASHRLRHVYRWGVGNKFGGGFQLRVTNIGGVAFQSIRVDAQIQYDVPRE